MKSLPLSHNICARLGIKPTTDLAQPHGTIVLANDSLFTQATYQQEVTTFGIGYADPARNRLAQLLDFLAPRRPGPRNAIITQYDETEPFETVAAEQVKREILGDFPTVKQRSSTKSTRALVNRGLSVVLDRDQLKEKPNWQQMHTAWLIDLLTRASILEVLALYTSFATAANQTWGATSNPDLAVVSYNQETLAPVTGFKANRACYGEAATYVRRVAYESQNNAGAYARASVNDADLAAAIGVDRVLVNAERYKNTTTKDTFLGSKVLLFSAQDQESPEDFSNVVRHLSATDLGGDYAVYVDEAHLKKVTITVENYELFATQHTTGCALLTISAT